MIRLPFVRRSALDEAEVTIAALRKQLATIRASNAFLAPLVRSLRLANDELRERVRILRATVHE